MTSKNLRIIGRDQVQVPENQIFVIHLLIPSDGCQRFSPDNHRNDTWKQSA